MKIKKEYIAPYTEELHTDSDFFILNGSSEDVIPGGEHDWV